MSIDGVHAAVREAATLLNAIVHNLGRALEDADLGAKLVVAGIDGTGRPGYEEIVAAAHQALSTSAEAREMMATAQQTAQAYIDST